MAVRALYSHFISMYLILCCALCLTCVQDIFFLILEVLIYLIKIQLFAWAHLNVKFLKA